MWLQGVDDLVAWYVGPGAALRRLAPAARLGQRLPGVRPVQARSGRRGLWALQVVGLATIRAIHAFLDTTDAFATSGFPDRLD
ncbi:MAG: hypothetical protein R2690_11885 [Acidimicrobiales bacterium]